MKIELGGSGVALPYSYTDVLEPPACLPASPESPPCYVSWFAELAHVSTQPYRYELALIQNLASNAWSPNLEYLSTLPYTLHISVAKAKMIFV